MVDNRLLVIVGPTGVGKTATALALAETFSGEVVSADTRQIFEHMDIGTAKPSPDELARVPHHFVGVVPPDGKLSLAAYQAEAYHKIDDILARGKLPLLVGGSGQYVRAVAEGWGIPQVGPDAALRDALQTFAEEHGALALHQRLAALDPPAAAKIDHRNIRRVIRALEVCIVSGERMSDLQRAQPPPYRILWLGLTRPREALYARVDARIEAMLAGGLVDEVRNLLAMGYSPSLPSMSALGYREVVAYLRDEITLEEAVARMKRETRRFIRQQDTWFRRDDSDIQWFDLERVGVEEIVSFVGEWLDSN